MYNNTFLFLVLSNFLLPLGKIVVLWFIYFYSMILQTNNYRPLISNKNRNDLQQNIVFNYGD